MTTTLRCASSTRRVSLLLVSLAAAALAEPSNAQTDRPGVPRFEPDPLWSELLPNHWVTGAVGGVAVDSHDNLCRIERTQRSGHRAP